MHYETDIKLVYRRKSRNKTSKPLMIYRCDFKSEGLWTLSNSSIENIFNRFPHSSLYMIEYDTLKSTA